MFVQALVGVTAAALLTAAPAQASTNWICNSLDNSPKSSTVINIVFTLIEQGYGSEDGAKVFVDAVQSQCPEYIPLIIQTVEKYGG